MQSGEAFGKPLLKDVKSLTTLIEAQIQAALLSS